jgi:hypothetical protein
MRRFTERKQRSSAPGMTWRVGTCAFTVKPSSVLGSEHGISTSLLAQANDYPGGSY